MAQDIEPADLKPAQTVPSLMSEHEKQSGLASPTHGTELAALPPASGEVAVLNDAWGPNHRRDLAVLTEDERKRMLDIVRATPRLDGAAVNAFGAEAQTRANGFLDELLAGIRTADAGRSGDLLAELATNVKMLDIPGMRREAEQGGFSGYAAKIPVLGRMIARQLSAFERFRARHQEVVDHFAEIEQRGRTEMAKIAAMDSRLDRLVEENLAAMKTLEIYLAAGQVVLDREKRRFAEAREAALQSRASLALAAVRDQGEQINGFETRLVRLHVAMADAMLSVPQTRTAQSAGRIEYRNILDTLLFDLPRLKAAIIRIAALRQISAASDASAARRRLSTAMADAGVEALDKAYTRAKESEGGALAEIAAMGTVADRILGIIDKGAAIDAKNRIERASAHQALEATRDKFVTGLAASTANAVVRSSEGH